MSKVLKKIIAFLALLVLLLVCLFLCGCNYKVVDLKYNFKKIHLMETGKCYYIDNWKDYDDSDIVQVKIKDKGYCIFHYNQIILIEDKCPICDAE